MMPYDSSTTATSSGLSVPCLPRARGSTLRLPRKNRSQADDSKAGGVTHARALPALTFIGMIGAALAVTLHRGGLLLAVLVLPLSIPVLIFGVAASQAAISGPLSFGGPFSILCALSLVSLVIGPFAAAESLRHGLD